MIFEKLKGSPFAFRKARKLLFYGNMHVLGAALMGTSGYWLFGRYGSLIESELRRTLALSGIDVAEGAYRIVRWGLEKGCFTIYLTRVGHEGARHGSSAYADRPSKALSNLRPWFYSAVVNAKIRLFLAIKKLCDKWRRSQ